MKAGSESKTKVRLAAALAIIAVLTVGWSILSSGAGNSTPDVASPTTSPAKAKAGPVGQSLDPRLQLDLLASSEQVKYEGTGKNIFRALDDVEIPTVKVSPLLRHQQEAAAARNRIYIPPPPPPINLKYFGVSSGKGEKTKAFLSDGDDVWVAREGDVVNRHYKIVRISPNSIEVEDLLNNNRAQIPLTQG
jgi:hypothetical protein